MSHGSGGNAKKVVYAALAGNLAIALCKFVAAYFSGSASTLAEAVHSVADTGNQALLLVGMVLAARGASELFAFGRATERYFWPFVVALILFSVGGAFAIYEGIHKIISPSREHGSQLWSLGVLFTSLVFEGMSFSVAYKEFKKLKGKYSYYAAIHEAKDPTIPLVLLEDTAALIGLIIALVAVLLTTVTGLFIFDSIGSILIGIVLCGTATLLARETHDLLIGESASPGMRRKVVETAEKCPGVVRVTQILTMHIGPDEILAALKVAFEPSMTVEKLEDVIDEMERQIRAEVPEMRRLFIEPDRRGDMRGVVEPAPDSKGAAHA